MASVLERGKAALTRARERWPLLDHALRMQDHYGRVNAGSQAGAVTYFAFLSFFPILALSFFLVGYVSRVYPGAQDNLVTAIMQVFPGMIGTGDGQISLQSIQNAATAVGLIGVVTLVYSGLGWLSGMRTALQVVFELPRNKQPNFFLGKLRDLVTLAVVGTILLLSVAISGVVSGFSGKLLDLLDLSHDFTWLVQVVGVLVGMAANMLLFFALFALLARPPTPKRSLWAGALLGALGFEVLKQASSHLLSATQDSAAFRAFGIALILLVWINYFSRVVMYAAAWAHTSASARAAREATPSPTTSRGPVPALTTPTPPPSAAARSRPDPRLVFGAGAASALGLVALLRRRRR